MDADWYKKQVKSLSEEEILYLYWFRTYVDLGPGEGDVVHYMNEKYMKIFGTPIPKGWRNDE